MKIAHEASDLAQFAHCTDDDVRGVVGVLADHRILRTDEAGRWEIFHDVLAGAVLGWKSRHDAERAVARASADARRRHRRLAFLAFGALVALSAMTALAVFAFSQRSQARDQARSARSGQLVASALSVLDSDPELGIELALEAARIEPTARAENALRLALDGSRVRAVIPTGHPVVGMDVDPARPRVLAVGDDGVARLYRLETGAPVAGRIVRSTGGAAAFLDGGRSVVLISGSRAGHARRGDRQSRAVSPYPSALAGVVDELVPSPDGRSAIVLTGKPRARVIALSTGARLGPGQASARRHRRRLLAGRPARRVGRARPDGRASGARRPGARSWTRCAATTDRCSRWHSTGRDSASPRGAPTRRPACGAPATDGRSPRCSATPQCERRRVRPRRRPRDGQQRRHREDMAGGRRAGAHARRPPWARPEGRVRRRRICGHRRRRRDDPRVGSRHQHRPRRSPNARGPSAPSPESRLTGRQRGRAGRRGRRPPPDASSASECSRATRTP